MRAFKNIFHLVIFFSLNHNNIKKNNGLFFLGFRSHETLANIGNKFILYEV